MTRLLLALIAIAAVFAAAPAHALVNASPVGKKTCYVHGNFSKQSSRTDISSYEPCGLLNDVSQYAGFRIEPMSGMSLTPIRHGQACYYIGNSSKASYFIPSGSDNEFNAFLAHRPAGVDVKLCTQPTEVSVQDRCGGLVTTSATRALYAQGFQAIGMGYVGERRTYYIVSQENKLLRTVSATGTANGWSFAFDKACPDTKSAAAQATPTATPAAFSRDGATQRVLINDGAVATKVQPTVSPVAPTASPVAVTQPAKQPAAQPAATTRVMITDGALVRNIKG